MDRQVWKRRLSWWLHHCALWGQPIAASVAAVSGGFLTYDFESLATRVPSWEGPVRWAQNSTPLIFIVSMASSLVMSILIAVKASRREKAIGSLESKLEGTRRQADEIGNVVVILFDGLLLNLANRLKLPQDAQARLSLYVHDPETRSFVPCGRYSRNPDFSRPGRTHYPDNEGCIAEGWRNDWHFDAQIPPSNQAAKRMTYNLKMACPH